MKFVKGLLVTAALIAPVAYGIHFAPDWTWQFFWNLKFPLFFALVIVTMAGALVIKNSLSGMKSVNQASSDYADFEFRMWTSVNTIAVMALLWVLTMAIPSPDFKKEVKWMTQTRTITKEVKVPVRVYSGIKEVYKHPTYQEAYELCTEAATASDEVENQAKICGQQALLASLPDNRKVVITRTLPAKNVNPDKFWEIVKACNDNNTVEGEHDNINEVVARRNSRIQVCTNLAKAATGQ